MKRREFENLATIAGIRAVRMPGAMQYALADSFVEIADDGEIYRNHPDGFPRRCRGYTEAARHLALIPITRARKGQL